MKIRLGISTKLIFMVTSLVVVAMTVVVYTATDLFREESLTRVQETNKDVAESLAERVFAIFKDTTEKMTLMAQTVAQSQGGKLTPESQQLIQNVIRSSDEILSFGIYRPEAGGYSEMFFVTKDEVLAEFDLPIDDLKNKPISQLVNAVRKRPDAITILNTSPLLKKPILSLGFLTKESALNKERWLVRVELRQEPLIKLFVKKSFITAYLVDADGNLLVHSNPKFVLQNYSVANYPIVQKLREGKLNNHQMEFEDDQGHAFIGAFKTLGIGGTGVVAQVEKEYALSAVQRVQYRALLITCIVLGLAFIINFIFSQSMTSPLSYLYWATEQISGGHFDVKLEPKANDEIGALTTAFKKMATGLQERDKLKQTFDKFHSKEVAQKILSGEIKLGGEKKMATIFFSDIRGFTPLSESMSPDEVVRLLNEYMTEMVKLIYKHHGVVDKYIGDAIMALWGVPQGTGNDAFNAVSAALEMRKVLISFNKKRAARDQPEIHIGMGIHTGEVLAGNIGSDQRLEYTVIGDTVNQASRIESANKELRCDLLISDSTFALVKSRGVVAGPPLEIRVKGKSEPITVHKLIGIKVGGVLQTALTKDEQEEIESGVSLYDDSEHHEEEDEAPAPPPRKKVIAKKPVKAVPVKVAVKAQAAMPKRKVVAPPPEPEPEEVEAELEEENNDEPFYIDAPSAPTIARPAPPLRNTVAQPVQNVSETIIRPGHSNNTNTMPPPMASEPVHAEPAAPRALDLRSLAEMMQVPPEEEPQALPEPAVEFEFKPAPVIAPVPAIKTQAPQSNFGSFDSLMGKTGLTQSHSVTEVAPHDEEPEAPMASTKQAMVRENTMVIVKTENTPEQVNTNPRGQKAQPPIPVITPKADEHWYLVKDPLSKEHDGPYTVAQIKVIAAQPEFPYHEAFVFKHGDTQMMPLSHMSQFSRRSGKVGEINAPLPPDALQAEADADEWYIYGDDTKTYGPYTVEQLREALDASNITRTTYAWRQGMEKWIYAYQIPGFNRRIGMAQVKGPVPLTKIKKPA